MQVDSPVMCKVHSEMQSMILVGGTVHIGACLQKFFENACFEIKCFLCHKILRIGPVKYAVREISLAVHVNVDNTEGGQEPLLIQGWAIS